MIYLNFFSHLNLAFLQKNKRKQKNEIKNETNTDIIWKVRKYHLSLVSTLTGGLTIMLGLFSRMKRIKETKKNLKPDHIIRNIPEPRIPLNRRPRHAPAVATTSVPAPWLQRGHAAGNRWTMSS